MSKPKSISEDTKRTILEAAWELILERRQADVAMSEVAARAGVSRQTIFYGIGNRADLLIAMVRYKDTTTKHVARLQTIGATPAPDREVLVQSVAAWLDYLPLIYPVGILLDAAGISDPEAAAAWNDRMIGALLGGFKRLALSIHQRHPLPDDPNRIADAVWAQVHPTMYRRLVVECGWSPDDFRTHALAMVRSLIGSGPSA
jgi:AcrR family transcriptional regulator